MNSTQGSGRTEAAKVLLRLPRDLHEQVKREAETQGVSTNTWLVSLIAGGTAFRKTA